MLRIGILVSVLALAASYLGPKDLIRNTDDYLLDHDTMCMYVDECEESKLDYICGSDGKTYESRCAFRRAACQHKSFVTFKRSGKCTVTDKCAGSRETALKQSTDKKDTYIPVCSSDGTYAPVQCHEGTGYCWCSTPSGKPIQGTTSKKHTRPQCQSVSALSTPKQAPTNSKTPSYRPKEGCEGTRRIKFNKKMIKNMLQELKRENSVTSALSKNRTEVLRWKFHQLDVNMNHVLQKRELRSLQRLVKRKLKPRRCAHQFPGFCDSNGDHKISKSEWVSCFFTKARKRGRHHRQKGNKTDLKLGKGPVYRPNPCKHDRQQALEASANSQNDMYIPTCHKSGFFNPLQCYGSKSKSIWYCFCVNVKTGSMIEKTSVKNGTAQCFSPQPWPRCESPKAEGTFLNLLIRYISQLAATSKSYRPGILEVPDIKKDIKTVFSHFDHNANNFIDKKERKTLRTFIRKNRKLRKCGNKIHIVCDDNSDKKISLKEFSTCVLPRKAPPAGKNSVVLGAREPVIGDTGAPQVNPFEEVIKSE